MPELATPNTGNEPGKQGNPDLALTEEPLLPQAPPANPQHGASVEFLGIVRDMEGDQKISGIEYRAYAPMATAMMEKIATEGVAEFEPHSLKLHHRIGFVPIAEPSVVIRVTTPHSQAAFDICRHYLRKLKEEIPIWKHPVPLETQS